MSILSRSLRRLAVAALIILGILSPPAGAQRQGDAENALARGLLKQLIEINTAPSGGRMTQATSAMASRLRAAGYSGADVQLTGPDAAHQNLVATLRGRDAAAKPVLLMAHIDVVEARASDWSMDPFTMHEKDGYFYGRGSTDNKGGAAVLVANMIRWKRERFVPARNVVMVLTTDEETSAVNGIQWLLAHVPALKNAEYALNTDAGGMMEQPGMATRFYVQSSEKMYQTFRFQVSNRGGHSSLPRDDNAIYALVRGLARLERFRFPVMYNEVTRESFVRSAAQERGQRGEDLRALARGDTSGAAVERISKEPSINGNLRTTCVATMLNAGHAENALPQTAEATVNCRIFPGVASREVQATLTRVVDDTTIHITPAGPETPSPASPLRPDVMGAVESMAGQVWSGAVVIPIMENGATDGLFLRNLKIPVYGISGPLFDSSDDRAHGRDERVGVRHFYDTREFWYRVVKELMGGAPKA